MGTAADFLGDRLGALPVLNLAISPKVSGVLLLMFEEAWVACAAAEGIEEAGLGSVLGPPTTGDLTTIALALLLACPRVTAPNMVGMFRAEGSHGSSVLGST